MGVFSVEGTWTNVQKETHAISVMTDLYKESCMVRKILKKHQATERKALQKIGAKFRAVTKNVKTRHVNVRLFSVSKLQV